jgi:hypothetical protein
MCEVGTEVSVKVLGGAELAYWGGRIRLVVYPTSVDFSKKRGATPVSLWAILPSSL